MAILNIRQLGDPVLRSKCKPVRKITDKTRELIDNMVDTMYHDDGVGLAAPQVGVLQKIIVIDTRKDKLITMINPKIVSAEGKKLGEEGCLSIPGKTGIVPRAEKVVVKGLNRKGKEYQIEASELLARTFQHEIDHLDGTLFIDKTVEIDEEYV